MSETFGNFLNRKLHEWRGYKLPEKPSQADFAVFLGVPTTNLSTWMSDQKKAGPEYIDIIAEKMATSRFGPHHKPLATRNEVYAAAGVAPRMSSDKRFSLIGLVWDNLDEAGRKEWYERAQNEADELGIKKANNGEVTA